MPKDEIDSHVFSRKHIVHTTYFNSYNAYGAYFRDDDLDRAFRFYRTAQPGSAGASAMDFTDLAWEPTNRVNLSGDSLTHYYQTGDLDLGYPFQRKRIKKVYACLESVTGTVNTTGTWSYRVTRNEGQGSFQNMQVGDEYEDPTNKTTSTNFPVDGLFHRLRLTTQDPSESADANAASGNNVQRIAFKFSYPGSSGGEGVRHVGLRIEYDVEVP